MVQLLGALQILAYSPDFLHYLSHWYSNLHSPSRKMFVSFLFFWFFGFCITDHLFAKQVIIVPRMSESVMFCAELPDGCESGGGDGGGEGGLEGACVVSAL